ncbi:unnamed protein product [Darwinula stevensoni]|uniref:Uncharacterized protein n=1 Tax=Darwinula stevensoni TaxID=69355 RepID=A0A7R9A5A1_9CRUS|nr:unnamed protein product [Darwinula stevensoni]CAG0885996.1 unnamed protein product [Darwinula stevensoni]
MYDRDPFLPDLRVLETVKARKLAQSLLMQMKRNQDEFGQEEADFWNEYEARPFKKSSKPYDPERSSVLALVLVLLFINHFTSIQNKVYLIIDGIIFHPIYLNHTSQWSSDFLASKGHGVHIKMDIPKEHLFRFEK